jgi:hypothetical protein
MQTFLPYASFERSVQVLDSKRLGKQRVETMQIMRALTGNGGLHGGWQAHPVARMWRGHLAWLMEYQRVTCHEWSEVRGHKDTCYAKALAALETDGEEAEQWHSMEAGEAAPPVPWFVTDARFRFTHRANLVRKAPELYIPHFGPLREDIPYAWTPETLSTVAQEFAFERLSA